MKAPYDSRVVANSFLILAANEKRSLTNMHVQKLVFFAHGYYLAVWHEPLIEETVQAWKFGPVIPGLYHRFKKFGGNAIDEFYMEVDNSGKVYIPRVNEKDMEFLKQVFNTFKNFSARELSAMTHADGSPWDSSYREHLGSIEIPQEKIREYFSGLLTTTA